MERPGGKPCGHEEIIELDVDGNSSSGSNCGAAGYTRTHAEFLTRVLKSARFSVISRFILDKRLNV